MRNLIRAVLGVQCVVTDRDAIEIARRHVVENGWPWIEPFHLNHGIYKIHVMTNANARGSNVNIWIRVTDGTVIRAELAGR